MCDRCRLQTHFSRRQFIKQASAGILASTGTGALAKAALAADSHAAPPPKPSVAADEALGMLKVGNKRFMANAEACITDIVSRRKDVASSQAPWATILTCADSRVPPELVFGGLSLGELFVVRNAGNLVDSDVLGTLEYGAEHLGSPLIVVMGHKRCGAVGAACDVVTKHAEIEGNVGRMISPVVNIAWEEREKGEDNLVDRTVRANAKASVKRLVGESTVLAELSEKKRIRIISAYYDLDSGAVSFDL